MDDRSTPAAAPPGFLAGMAIACGRLLFRVRDYLFPLIVLILVVTTSPGAPDGKPWLDPWLDALGFALACLGQFLRLLTVGSVTEIRRGGDHGAIAADSLIRTGVFAATRNPLYVGDWMIVCGLVLIANCRWWYLLVLPGFTIGYILIVLAEEDFLARKFVTEYRGYVATVNRFLPARGLLGSALRSGGADWRRALAKEARIICSWLAAAVVLFLWEEWTHLGRAMWATGATHALLAVLIAVLASRGMLVLMGRSPTRFQTPGPAAARTHPPDRP
jgi:protein-S-isoprenylcysteine O-methyltransferase Ste14